MHVVVCGAGPVGAVVALLLASEGHRVTVLDPRPAFPPVPGPDSRGHGGGASDRLWAAGERPLVLLAEAVRMMSGELPAVARTLASLGALGRGANPVVHRPLIARVLMDEMSRTDGIRVDRGVGVASLLTGKELLPGRPHVQGVLTDGGEAVLADLTVDAAGRSSKMVRQLGEIGAPRPLEERQDSGMRLYTRRFDSPRACYGRAGWSVRHFDGVTVALVSAGRGGCSMTLGIGDEDLDLYPLAGPSAWSRAARLYEPLLPPLPGSPAPGVWVTPRVESSYRRFVLGGRPVATGTVSVGDAWAATNPLLGLGPSMALLHTVLLRDALRQGGVEDTAVRFDRLTEDLLSPLHHRITDWEERLQARNEGAAGDPSPPPTDLDEVLGRQDATPVTPVTPVTLARDLQGRFSAISADAASSTRTGPSRAQLVEALAHRSTA
ncbi:FAD-dependent oxidoreductase [Streptomyces sp. NPDC055254]